jgi:hypothetical protein
MWIEGSRMLYEAGSRRRGVWLGVSLCLSASALSLSRDLLLCARGMGCYRGLQEEILRRWLWFAPSVVYEDGQKIEVEPAARD